MKIEDSHKSGTDVEKSVKLQEVNFEDAFNVTGKFNKLNTTHYQQINF